MPNEPCCEVPGAGCSREDVFRTRVQSLLRLLQCQFPTMAPRVDFWRPALVSPSLDECGDQNFVDDQTEVWVRMGEDVPSFLYEKEDRFFQADVGVVRMRVSLLYIPEGMGIRPDDHVVIAGTAYMVTDAIEDSGVAKLKIEAAKSRFRRPARSDKTYRQLEIKAAIL